MDLKSLENHFLIVEFNSLIHFTLKRLNISQSDNNYEDLAQELRIHLLKLRSQFNGNPLKEERYAFTNYASKGLYWHACNLLNRNNSPEKPSEYTILWADREVQEELDEVHLQGFYEACQKILNSKEWCLFQGLVAGEDFTNLSKRLNISLSTLYDWRKKLQDKLMPVKYYLEVK